MNRFFVAVCCLAMLGLLFACSQSLETPTETASPSTTPKPLMATSSPSQQPPMAIPLSTFTEVKSTTPVAPTITATHSTAQPSSTPYPELTEIEPIHLGTIYYVKAGDKELWRVNADGSQPHLLHRVGSEAVNIVQLSLSPHKDTLVFVTDHLHEQTLNPVASTLWLLKVEGTELIKLWKSGFIIYSVSWSPDNHFLAYAELLFFDTPGNVYIVDSETGSRQQVANFGKQVAWSPDGRRLAFVETGELETQGVQPGLYLFDISTKERILLLQSVTDLDLTWSPDGKTLAVGDGLIDVNTAQIRPADIGAEPRWSPGGKWISSVYGTWLYVLDTATGEKRLLLKKLTSSETAWSRDGHFILCMADIVGPGVYVINVDENEFWKVPNTEDAWIATW